MTTDSLACIARIGTAGWTAAHASEGTFKHEAVGHGGMSDRPRSSCERIAIAVTILMLGRTGAHRTPPTAAAQTTPIQYKGTLPTPRGD